MQGMNSAGNSFDRRQFLETTSKGVLATSLLGLLNTKIAHAQQTVTPKTPGPETTPVKLPPLDHPTEVKEAPPPAPMAPEKRIGFAIVGLGKLSLDELLPAFGECKFAKVTALVSGDATKAQKVASQYGVPAKNIYNYQNFDTIKDNPDVDVVYIVLPNGMHEEYTIRAAKAGKHVLCEKPMANTVKEADNMIKACKDAGRKLMIAYRIQYEPANKLAKEWTRNSKYGKVKVIEAYNGQHIGDPTQWRLNKKLAGGGSLPDIGLYCLNTIRYLLGEEPEWVNASVYSTPNDARFKEVEETVMFQLRFPSGVLANCTTSYGAHVARRYRCLADGGGWFGLDPAFAYNGLKMEASYAEGETEYKISPLIPQKNQFALEMDHMAECVMNNKEPFTPGEEGLQDQRIMEAIYQSAKDGKPVKLEKITKMDPFRGTPPSKD